MESVLEQKSQQLPSIEKMELPPHVDVSRLMAEKNAFFVHMIQVTKELDVSQTNKSGIDTKKLLVPDKLDMLYGASPTLSASTIRPHTNDNTFYGGFGVIFSHGQVEHASTNDNDTFATSIKGRHIVGGARNKKEDVYSAIDRSPTAGGYNELVLKEPEVAGGFMKLASFHSRLSYEEEEQEYYDGEKVKMRIGEIDMGPKLDRFGRPTGENADTPFFTLLEMSKRGKVFVMNEDNQMMIVKDIDEASKKVTFIDNPIEPNDFAYYYGKERMNKYAKQEIRDRLEKSLAEKGMSLS
jgi:hypothetical protein